MRTLYLLLVATATLFGQPRAKDGLDPQQLARIPGRMQELVNSGDVPCAVTLVARHGEIASLDAVGWLEIETKRPVRRDSIFQLMSMTKPFTAVGILMLVEEGRVVLGDPVERYLPDFAKPWVIDSDDGKTRTLHRAPRSITVRDLLTHTSGLPGAPPGSADKITVTMDRSLADAVLLDSQAPLLFDPGAKWSYSNPGIATLGRIIEVVSGEPYEKFLDERIFRPLGMKDTFFYPPADKLDRIALLYKRENGEWKKAGPETQGGDPWKYRKGAKYPCPECGLFSTATDLLKFYQTMLNGGASNGVRLLLPPTVQLMTANHTASIRQTGAPGWGLGWSVVADAPSTPDFSSPGTFGHGGAFGTDASVDPKKDLIRIFLTSIAGGNTGTGRNAFMQMAGAAAADE